MSKGKIWATTTSRDALKKKFDVCPATLTVALNFQTDSLLGRRIRSYAVNFLRCAIWMDEDKFI